MSALVHSSTLVTAGVYLLVRFRAALEGSLTQTVLLLLSRLTMFIAGLGANFEYDLKKIIALSTLSQLGVIIRILSLGYANLAFFHLLKIISYQSRQTLYRLTLNFEPSSPLPWLI